MFARLTRRFENIGDRTVLVLLLGIGIGMVIGSARTYNLNGSPWWDSFLQNFSTEMFGAFLTFLLIEVLVSRRREKQILIRQMRSRVPAEARRALEELRAERWLYDGSLRGADLARANLQGADLRRANLRGASLLVINLQRADLSGANLQGADLWRANLQGANFEGPLRVERGIRKWAILPDSTPDTANYWTPDTDMARFTDPDHPDFWRSDDPRSPAYRGADDPDDPGHKEHKRFWPDD